MKILEIDYRDLTKDIKCLTILPIEFIEKYGCLIYCKHNNGYVVLITSNFEYYNINKLSFFIKEEIYLCYVNDNSWSEILKSIKLSDNRSQAINKFKIKTDLSSQNALNDDSTKFYDIEIENSPIVKIVESIIEEGINLGCSDIHFEPQEKIVKVRFRIDGKLQERSELPIESLPEISTRIKVLSNLDITKKFIPQDGKLNFEYENKIYDIRVSIIPGIFGERLALRILDLHKGLMKLEDLKLNKYVYGEINKIINLSSGLVLVVGPTGSGKSTTLHAFLEKNLERNENIITVEDPVEYTIPGITQVQVNNEAGLDFATCLKTILRQDPNIIMIGEIRDLETAQIACRASITGHLVYSTLHTNTSVGVINRLKDMNVEPYLLVDALRAVISQRLVRCLCDKCKEKVKITKIDAKFLNVDEDISVFIPKGCNYCNMTGYSGRCGVYEVIVFDDDFRKLIIENSSINKFWNLIKKKKIEKMIDYGRELIINGITSIEEVQSILN
ncbi:MAG: type II/IV secretion system protein [Erysipelotrichaceae bacterium]|nr:type II/IV secretion system protein [Erysipelotrichaceae bacterium]